MGDDLELDKVKTLTEGDRSVTTHGLAEQDEHDRYEKRRARNLAAFVQRVRVAAIPAWGGRRDV